jgi:putative ABC transport system permease protein
MIDTVVQDLRYAARTLARAPGFTAVAVLTLALGIGANTAIFSVVHGVILKALPYEDPDRIVRIAPGQVFNMELVDRLARESEAFAVTSAYVGKALTLTGVDRPEEFQGALVEPDYFAVLGVQPAMGRGFRPEEKLPGADPVVIISHGLWQRRFGADPAILGRRIAIGGTPHAVVGVMPQGYRPLDQSWEAWVPAVFDPAGGDYRDHFFWRPIGRLAPGVTPAQARDDIERFMARMHAEDPDYYGAERIGGAGVVPLSDDLVGPIRPTLLVLLGAVAAVLLVACANVANMLLARAGAREREISIRAALGAGRPRLVRQLLTESALLGVLGGAAGVLAAVWTESSLLGFLPRSVPRAGEIGIDLPEIVFAFGVSLVSVVLFGLAPALRATGADLQGALKSGSRGGGGAARHRLNRGRVGAEVALSVVLVVGAGLMLKSLWRMLQVDPGFDAPRVVTMRLTPPADRYPDAPRQSAYYKDVEERLRAVPGVLGAGGINVLPMTTRRVSVDYTTPDHPLPSGGPPQQASYRIVTEGYFRAMGIPLLRGRPLDGRDRAGAPAVGLINETMARRLRPDGGAVGREIRGLEGEEWFTIVGVVADIQQRRLDVAPEPEIYRPFDQEPSAAMHLNVRAEAGHGDLIAALQRAVWAVDGEVPIAQVATMAEVIDRSLAESRFFALLLSAFAGLALALGAIGVYGVGSYTVSRLTGEIGVRMALGAAPGRMLRFVIGREMVPVGVGLAIGVVAALLSTRLLAGFLFEVTATDPATFICVSVVLALVALLAVYVPARRAARVDPLAALRAE